jgi:hypothetical protein
MLPARSSTGAQPHVQSVCATLRSLSSRGLALLWAYCGGFMDLFCFASRNVENIWIGVKARTWAVATVSDAAVKGRKTKARKNLNIGSRGILYCNPTQSFTTPFIVDSRADPERIVTDIWPQPWSLPFLIRPLGDPSRQLYMRKAMLRWPLLARRGAHQSSVSAAMNLTGVTVFAPVDMTEEDWQIIIDDLATDGRGDL